MNRQARRRDARPGDDTSDEGPSQRPYETLTALKAKLNLTIDARHRKSHFAEMATSALACDGAVLIAWQHEDIALKTKTGNPGISAEILTQTETTGTLNVPTSWPGARHDLVFVFDRPTGCGPITGAGASHRPRRRAHRGRAAHFALRRGASPT